MRTAGIAVHPHGARAPRKSARGRATAATPAPKKAARGRNVRGATWLRPIRFVLRTHVLLWERMSRVARAWSADRCFAESAALGFFAAFSLAPMLVVVIAVAGFFFGSDAVQGRLLSEMQAVVGKDAATAVQALVASAWQSGASGWVSYLSIGAVVVGASATFSQLTRALNWIWRAPPIHGAVATLLKIRLLSFGMVLGASFLLIVLLIMDAALAFTGSALLAHRDDLAAPLVFAVRHAFVFIVLFGAFGVLLKVLPEVHVRWRDAGLGALVATILFSVGKHVLALYLSHAGTASAFGAAGSLAVVMMWLFFSAAVFLLGAEVAAHALPRSADPELVTISESRAKKR